MTKVKKLNSLKDLKNLEVLEDRIVLERALIETGVKTHFNNIEVRPAGNHSEVYPPTGYSKYMDRWTALQDGKLKGSKVAYGFPQALEHIEELRRAVVKGKYPLARAKFEIVETIIIKTSYTTLKG